MANSLLLTKLRIGTKFSSFQVSITFEFYDYAKCLLNLFTPLQFSFLYSLCQIGLSKVTTILCSL